MMKKGRGIYKGTKRFLAHSYRALTDKKIKVLLLVYHRVLDGARFNPLNNIVQPATFIRQIDAIAKKYSIVTLSDIIEQCRLGRTKGRNQVVLTFDDGYSDNYEIAFPVLQKKGLPAAFFLITDYMNSNKPLWDWQIINILSDCASIKNIELPDEVIRQGRFEPRLSFTYRILNKMKPLTFTERQGAISSLKVKTSCAFNSDRCMTWEEAKKMSESGMEIGSHSLSHRSLARIPFLEAKEEIRKSKEIIGYHMGRACRYFSFPFGGRQDYNQQLIDYAKEVGYQACLSNVQGYNYFKEDSLCFKRIIMEEATDTRYLLG